MDAANLFKPALARGDIQIIGATTLNEYRKYIEKDGALERRFQKIIVNQPSTEDTVKILLGLQQKYEIHHQIRYLPESINACVELSERYITDKFLPDKAIDVMDEVGARIHINNIFVPDNIVKLEDEIRVVRLEKEAVIKEQQFEKAASLRDKERKLINKLSEFEARWNEDNSKNQPKVNEEDVANVISMMTGIPINRVAESESVRLINMTEEIGKEIIGQDNSIEILSKAIRRARTGFKDPRHPIGSFMFVGPTGVGKTEMAKALARHLFGNENSLIKMDMSEYMERHNVSRLIGAPPGYVGYDEGGQLTEKVRRNPFSVVLFDEIEKAHPDVYNLLLQILDEGKLSDNLGRMIDFRNTIVIMTTNLGTKSITETSIGFSKKEDDRKELELNIHADIKKKFKPEFLNRLDEVIIFNQLTINNLSHIIDIQLQNIVKNLSAKNIQFKISKRAKELLIQDANYKEWGARPLRRVIQNRLENYISEKFLTGEFTEGGVINVKTEKGNLLFTQIHKKSKKKITAKSN
jgi:ATP-dependent Clp protease ATP-binding subunit ClpC